MRLIFSRNIWKCMRNITMAPSKRNTGWSSIYRYTTLQTTPIMGAQRIDEVLTRCSFSTSTRKLLPLPDDAENVVQVKNFVANVSDRSPDLEEDVCPETGLEFVHIDLTCFMLSAWVRLPAIPDGEEWQVGYVQGIKKAILSDHYGSTGTIRTIIPEIDSGRQEMVADSDGSQYNWYAMDSMTSRRGPARPQFLTVKMFDTPCANPCTTNSRFLEEPEAPGVGYLPQVIKESPLTHISKHIEFCAWLVIRCANTGEYKVLVSTEWKVILHMEYNITKPQGERITHLAGNGIQEQPIIKQHNPRDLPDCVLSPPCANEAAMVVWSPLNRDVPEKIVVPPAWAPGYQIPVWNPFHQPE